MAGLVTVVTAVQCPHSPHRETVSNYTDTVDTAQLKITPLGSPVLFIYQIKHYLLCSINSICNTLTLGKSETDNTLYTLDCSK